MLFHSPAFAVFFLVFLVVFALIKQKGRVWFTAAASLIFYAWWYPPYLLLLLGFTAFAFYGGLLVRRLSRQGCGILLAICLLPLCFFKYTHFVLASVFAFSANSAPLIPHWSLPLGISFITFTVMAYLIDVRQGLYEPEGRFQDVALYISFFPHLIAGPIMRPKELFPQFQHLRIKSKLVRLGLFFFSTGLVKKVLFADTLAPIVEAAYASAVPLTAGQSFLAFYGFAVQIYCDFSGYVDMALGLAFMLGVRLPLNFNRPYLAESISDFWRRWHITLSRWLRDYLYIPLGGSRHGALRTFMALMMTMALGGLWHGAAWTFLFWGIYHGSFLAIEHLAGKKHNVLAGLPLWIKRLLTFHVVCVGWVLFRAHGLEQVGRVFAGLFTSSGWKEGFVGAPFAWTLIVAFFALHVLDRASLFIWFVRRQRPAVIYALCAVVIMASMAFSVGNPSAFIYFDF